MGAREVFEKSKNRWLTTGRFKMSPQTVRMALYCIGIADDPNPWGSREAMTNKEGGSRGPALCENCFNPSSTGGS
jgi:hypothetical protein